MSKIAFLFPGQGAQAVGMGAELVAGLPAARELYDRAREVLGYDLARLCFDGPADELDATDRCQPALFVTSLAALELLRRDRPDVVEGCAYTAGLSLGEYTALVFAGVMSFEDGLRLVQARGTAMQAAATAIPSGMVSVLGLELAVVEACCDEARGSGVLQVANHLCPGNIAVSGDAAACERVAQLAEAKGAMKAVRLSVAGAFHTPIMQPAVEQLRIAVDAAEMRTARIPVISNVDARPYTDPGQIRELLVRQVVSPVLWEASQRWLLAAECREFYEVGPGRVLRGLLKRIDRSATCHGVMG